MLQVFYPQGSYEYGYHATVHGTQDQADGSRQTLDTDLSALGTWQVTGRTDGQHEVNASFRDVDTRQAGTRTASQLGLRFLLGPHGAVTFQQGALPSPGSPTSVPGADQFISLLPAHPVQPSDTWS